MVKKENLGGKKFFVQKIFWSKNFLAEKKFRKKFWLRKFLVEILFCQINFFVKKILVKRNFWSKTKRKVKKI